MNVEVIIMTRGGDGVDNQLIVALFVDLFPHPKNKRRDV
jgi:hypothetical protein